MYVVTVMTLTVVLCSLHIILLVCAVLCVFTGQNSKIGGLVWLACFSQFHFQTSKCDSCSFVLSPDCVMCLIMCFVVGLVARYYRMVQLLLQATLVQSAL